MRAVVIYESLTGTTARAASMIGDQLAAAGMGITVCAVNRIDYQALSEADLVIVGTWTDGIVVTAQRPGRAYRLRGMPAISGKRAIVFATYAIDPGRVLDKLVAIVEGRGAEVLGGMTIRRDRLEASTTDFVDRVLTAVAPA
ncbi:MAG: flavodoxin family protein [Acidimicrobiales bacterium]